MSTPYRTLDSKRQGASLDAAEIDAVVRGATDGSWSDAQLAAFLMAAAIHGLDREETTALTTGMLNSGERWRLSEQFPTLGDKHSTGGVGDKVSLVLAPLLAACDVPVAMLTGRGLGHTGGTADKLEGVPGLCLDLSRQSIIELLESIGMAVGIATGAIAPADRKLYALRDVTGTVASIPLIVASIVSKKLALGAKGIVYDVKTGSGAFLEQTAEAKRLAELLVETTRDLGAEASALVTDMSQPLGRWVGHDAEVLETLDCLRGEGPADLTELAVAQAVEVGHLVGKPLERSVFSESLSSGRAYERFLSWAEAQGATAEWLAEPIFELAPHEVPVRAPNAGLLAAVDAREIGLAVAQAGGGRRRAGDRIDHGVAFRYDSRIGRDVARGEPLGFLYLRQPDDTLADRMATCFTIGDHATAPPLIWDRVGAGGSDEASARFELDADR